MEEEEELQEFLEDKMKEKIIIINEIEKYEPNFKISCLKEDKQLELSLRTSRRWSNGKANIFSYLWMHPQYNHIFIFKYYAFQIIFIFQSIK